MKESSQKKPNSNTRVESRQCIILPEQWYYGHLHNNSTEQIHKIKFKNSGSKASSATLSRPADIQSENQSLAAYYLTKKEDNEHNWLLLSRINLLFKGHI